MSLRFGGAFCALVIATITGARPIGAQQIEPADVQEKADSTEEQAREKGEPDVRRPVVHRLRFRGNEAIPARALRISIATESPSLAYRMPVISRLFGEPPSFDYTEFRRDLLRIKAMYGVRGFPDARVDTTIARDGEKHSITVSITENEPITVDSLEVIGTRDIFPAEELTRALPLRIGEPFDRLLFSNSVDLLQIMLRNEGHAFARVTGGFRASADGRSVAVQLTAVPGPRATVERIIIEGADRIDERVILKALAIRPGEVYSAKALEDSQLDLFQMDMFRHASVRLVDSVPDRPGDSTVTVQVIVRVTENTLQRARLSAGYGTLSCFRGMGSVDLFNFPNGGRRLEIRAGTSLVGVGSPLDLGFRGGMCPLLAREDTSRLRLNYNTSVTLHEPMLFSRRATGTVSVFAERHTELGAFMRETMGAEVGATRTIAEKTPLRVGYLISFGRTLAEPATFCAFLNVCRVADMGIFTRRRTRSVISLRLVRDRTNSAMDPTEGTASSFELRWAPRLLHRDSLMRFAKLSAGFEAHRPVGLATLSFRFEAGTMFSSHVTLGGGAVSYAPPEERFYSGGSNTVRGFAQNQLGPVVRIIDSLRFVDGVPVPVIRTSPIGGNTFLLGSTEFRFPIPLPLFTGKLQGALFVDAGQVSEVRRLSLQDLRVTPGVGLRLASLVGPIRVDVAYNPYRPRASALYRRLDGQLELAELEYRPEPRFSDRFRLHFSIGQPF